MTTGVRFFAIQSKKEKVLDRGQNRNNNCYLLFLLDQTPNTRMYDVVQEGACGTAENPRCPVSLLIGVASYICLSMSICTPLFAYSG